VGDGDGTEGIEEALRRWCPGPHHQPPSPSTFFL
jgi:hypothetical protein